MSRGVLLATALLASACLGGGKGITPVRTAFNKGVHHQAAGDWDAARHEYEKALREDADDHRARFNLATVLEAQARSLAGPERAAAIARAEEEYRAVLARRPDDLRAGINLAALELESGRRMEGEARLAGVIEAHGGVAAPRAALGAHHLRRGELAEAESLLRAARDIDPADPTTNLLLGDTLARQGRLDEAEAAYRRAVETEPANLAALYALGRLEADRDEPAVASAWLRRLLLVDPDHALSHRLLSDVHEATGDLRGAVRHLWHAQELGPEREEDAERLAELYRRLLSD